MSAPQGSSRNRLGRESSPYLLLHASNPVDWYPWGEEAFARARSEDKPIFLSVGYSTCYWCHVMEREAFSDPAIARAMNEGFVCIKLDREERPDLDEIYMAATQLLTHSGGWPNSLFLTPDLKPFFAGTYFPPDDRFGRPGFPRVLASLREAWEKRRPEVLEQSEAVAQAMKEYMGQGVTAAPGPPDAGLVAETQIALAQRFDAEWGGFGSAPKFPSPSNLFFLLERARDGEAQARDMLVVTLDRMARGGIQDHLAGGFHRYSTDAEWLVPHFEKMLYDNASLAVVYAEAAPLALEGDFDGVARRTLDFVLSELTAPEGGFLSAIDAQTDGHEGAYYTWTREELRAALGPEFALLASVYGFEGRPTFERDRYVLHLPVPLPERARLLGIPLGELRRRLEPGRKALLEARARRPRPLVDDKVLTDWNGLMIAAMARSGELLGEPRYTDAALRAADFVLARLADPETRLLLHAYRAGSSKIAAMLDDYAFLVQGLLALHSATRTERWLREALRLVAEQEDRLWDDERGGYFAAPEDPRLLFRAKSALDGAVASGNGTAALNLLTLAEATGEGRFRQRAESLLRAFGTGMTQSPLAHVTLGRALRRMGASETSPAEAKPDRFRTKASTPVPSSGREKTAPTGLEETARSVVKASGRLQRDAPGPWKPFTLDLHIREGWHVNANPASHASLIPTRVRGIGATVRGIRYPEGEPYRLAASQEPVSVYRGRVRVEGEVEVAGEQSPSLSLTYQPCDDTRCLPEVTTSVSLL